jgi:hypothetical protein
MNGRMYEKWALFYLLFDYLQPTKVDDEGSLAHLNNE